MGSHGVYDNKLEDEYGLSTGDLSKPSIEKRTKCRRIQFFKTSFWRNAIGRRWLIN